MQIHSENISIRTFLVPGDIGYIAYLHGKLYNQEYHYGITFETYVARGLLDFYESFDSHKDRVWICENKGQIIGFLLLQHREQKTAQLRYFIVHPDYRGSGLGKQLMNQFMEFLRKANYTHCYLWTTDELDAAASLYTRHGFILTEEKESDAFGKLVMEQRYDWIK